MEWIYLKVGQKIREIRTVKRISQEELSRSVGLTRTSIVNIEHGRQKIMLHTLYAVADALGITVAQLLPSADQADEQILSDPLATVDQSVLSFFKEIQKKANLNEEGESS